ncbi:hypothetical protein Mnod_4508 [Methylobacterium nodulans ORS 2060]|uniref:Uncharacterized protein n=1 Tax=Methylobacterium nodulans (strain LMG 21967 / CNCM I-2342 / ORS 2060) TaxID=460265 RepID=B8ICY4_METNO|nr:hypothetical protein Mnod_4508 [Methylobacterium nodulans ORS 2060]
MGHRFSARTDGRSTTETLPGSQPRARKKKRGGDGPSPPRFSGVVGPYAAAETSESVGTEEIVFSTCEAIW